MDASALNLSSFRQLVNEGNWLVMFYAPWCGHCQRLHPTWDDVGRALAGSEIHVGKIDATKFSDLAQEYDVKGFPTLKFFRDGNTSFVHYGGRTTNAIIDFASRAKGPSLRILHSPGHFKGAKQKHKHEIFFLLLTGDQDTEDTKIFEEKYKNVSEEKILEGYFYIGKSHVVPEDIKQLIKSDPQLLVFKEDVQYLYEGDAESMWKWINEERFLFFPKVDEITFHETTTSGKLVVLLAIDQDYDNYKEQIKLSNIVRKVAWDNRERYHPHFQVAWMNGDTVVKAITMSYVDMPFLLVFNASSGKYYIPDVAPLSLTLETFTNFLDNVLENKNVVGYGGNSFIQKIYRIIWNIYSTVKDIWDAQPILALVFFLLPTLLICFVCYNMCTMEDSEEEGDEFMGEEVADKEEEKEEPEQPSGRLKED